MRHRIMSAVLFCALLFTACGAGEQTAGEGQTAAEREEGERDSGQRTGEPESVEESAEKESDSIGAEEEKADGSSAGEPETPETVYREDTNEYGNIMGNLYNDGTLTFDKYTNFLYFYNLYEGSVVGTSLETGDTVSLMEGLFTCMNFRNGRLYGIGTDEDGGAGGLTVYDTETGTVEVLREKPLHYLQAVNGALYFTDGEDNTLRSMPLEGGEEEVLTEEPVYFPVVYKDRIIFQRDADNESLYSMSVYGGETTKLNDMPSYYPLVYRDRIYYQAVDAGGGYTLRSMGLDGSDERILADVRVLYINLYDDRLYYVEADRAEEVFYLDLTEEQGEPRSLNLKDSVGAALKETYGVTQLQVTGCGPIQFGNDCILFLCTAAIDGTDYVDEYLYRIDTGEILIMTEFCKMGETARERQEETSQHI